MKEKQKGKGKDLKREPKVPKVRDIIYVESYQLENAKDSAKKAKDDHILKDDPSYRRLIKTLLKQVKDDFTGGKAYIVKVRKNKSNYQIKVEERPEKWYDWENLSKKQKKLRRKFKDKWAHTCPDGAWIRSVSKKEWIRDQKEKCCHPV